MVGCQLSVVSRGEAFGR